jgi:SurA N-terminal domain
MFRFLRKHRTVLFVSLAFCLIGMLFFGIGGTSMVASPHDTIIKINGQKISQREFDRVYNQMLRQKGEGQVENGAEMTSQALNELIRSEVFNQEAKRYELYVPEQELQMQLASTPAFQKDGQFDFQTYYNTLRQVVGIPPAEFEKLRTKDIAARKLNQLIASSVRVPESTMEEAIKARLALEPDPKKKKELMSNPDLLREEIRSREVNMAFTDWLSQLNSTLKVEIISETFRKRLTPPAPAAPAPAAPPVGQP